METTTTTGAAMATTTAPIATEIVDLLAHQGIEPGRDYSVTANSWRGIDLSRSGLVTVRIALDDNEVKVHVLEGRGQLLAATASFVNMPAAVIVATVAAYLA